MAGSTRDQKGKQLFDGREMGSPHFSSIIITLAFGHVAQHHRAPYRVLWGLCRIKTTAKQCFPRAKTPWKALVESWRLVQRLTLRTKGTKHGGYEHKKIVVGTQTTDTEEVQTNC